MIIIMFYRLLFGKEAEDLRRADKLIGKEIADFRVFVQLFTKKVKLLKEFVKRVNRQRNVTFSRKKF